jgi:hypothetical protein
MDEDEEMDENIWERLLSRQPTLIGKAYQNLDPVERKAVLDHLIRMVTESGWQPEQRISAQAALDSLSEYPD